MWVCKVWNLSLVDAFHYDICSLVNRYLGKTNPHLQWRSHPHQIHLINQGPTLCQLTIWKFLSTPRSCQHIADFQLITIVLLKVTCSFPLSNSLFSSPYTQKVVTVHVLKELLFNTVPITPGVINQSNGYGSHFNGNNYEYSRRVLGTTLDSISHFRSRRHDTSNPIYFPSYS